jgi:7-carboxy-7-deazaguanine synthase
MSKTALPIAEEFHSVKGEGLWTGTPMKFIRLAGCSVGRYDKTNFPYEICHTYDGREFLCDTNFRKHYMKTPEELLEDVYEERIVITGGEPLIHDLEDLIDNALNQNLRIHLETSGTIPLPSWCGESDVWIAVSPKQNTLPEVLEIVDEVKILVDKDFSLEGLYKALPGVRNHPLVWLMPINGIRDRNENNLQLCLEILKLQRPDWRLCVQVHKLIGVK